MKWLQHYGEPGLSEADLQDHIRLSYELVAAGLSKKLRHELGIPIPEASK